ncbi:MAG: GspMb/PilO family protein [Candidatus Magasanikbacteria bacterium]|jgi:hypothetical protein
MLSATREQKVISLVIAMAIAVAVILLGVIYPTVRYINRINQNTLELRQYLEKRLESVKRMHSSREKINEIKEPVERFNENLFFAGDELKLITELENLANHHRVEQKIENTNLDQANKQQINITLVTTGPYDTLLRYLADLEAENYFLNVTKINWSASGGVDQKQLMTQMHIELNLYVSQ